MVLVLTLLAEPAAAADVGSDGPARVGPRTGDHPTITDICIDEPVVTTWIVRRTTDWSRFGPLPMKRSFDVEMVESLELIAPLDLVPEPTAP